MTELCSRNEREVDFFYFGEPGDRLFGAFHPPCPEMDKKANAIICHPFGHEYIYAHKALRVLSNLLAQEGIGTLRFDFYGCGDSEGEKESGSISKWLSDLVLAINQVKGINAADKLCLIGCRLGGSLSAMIAEDRDDIDSLVLWEPTVNGSVYLEEIEHLHKLWLRSLFRSTSRSLQSGNMREIFGFPLTDKLIEEILVIDLFKNESLKVKRLLHVNSTGNDKQSEFGGYLQNINNRAQYIHVPANSPWDRGSKVINETPLRAIAKWVGEIFC